MMLCMTERETERVRAVMVQDREGDSDDDGNGSSVNPFRDIEIHLNRFTDPPVWVL